MRVAAIDVGTNSIHLLVAEISAEGLVSVVEKDRVQVMLGSGGLGAHRLQPDAFERGVTALETFARAARSLDVEDIHCAATSAVREAANGAAFCREVKERTGIHVRVIPGTEEGRVIWLGARDHLDFSRGPLLLCDLGGGSTEMVLGDASGLRQVLSLPLGHIRLTDRFRKEDPMHPEERRQMKRAIRAELGRFTHAIPKGAAAAMVGTSGTIRCLARMATLHRGDPLPEHDEGLVLHRREVELFLDLFEKLPRDRVAELPGMDDKRKETLPAGAVLVRELMKASGLTSLTTSARSLRDGLIVDWVEKHRPEIDLSGRFRDPRERTIHLAMGRFGVDEAHARYVSDLADEIFRETRALHGLSDEDGQLLRAASLLHDIGHHIAPRNHHKHGQYLLKHIRMYGFTAPDVAILSSIVRYHSRSTPKGHHVEWRALSKEDRHRVRVLAGILKLADALDRSHEQPVTHLTVHVDDRELTLHAKVRGDANLERWALEGRKELLQHALDRTVRLELVSEDDELLA